ncbi:MAG TPA: hypothetical protein VNE39_11265 [Planctomycetota bacterium]|nr:hypothetical protein [Planctomycetota bacterium]
MNRFAVILAVALFALPAVGDVVHLKKGGALEGQVTLTDDGAVIVVPGGTVTVAKGAIDRIEKKETAIEQYLKRAAGIKEDDAEAHFQLGLWARGAGLKAYARDEFGKALALKPDHDGAHQALGHRKVDGKWMTREQEMQAKGLVERDGQWMTPEAAVKYEALKAEVEAARAKHEAAEADLQKPAERPTYTYDAYYASRPSAPGYYATVPYYGSSYGYTFSPYVGSYYGSTWPSSYYWIRPYPSYTYSSWPRSSFYLGGYSGRDSHHSSGGRPGGGRPGGGRPGGHH